MAEQLDIKAPQADLENGRQKRQAVQPPRPFNKYYDRGSQVINNASNRIFNDEKNFEFRQAFLLLKKYQKVLYYEKSTFRKRINFYEVYQKRDIFSSIYDQYLTFPYIGFTYKRAVKIVFQDKTPYVTVASDTDLFGICVDVDIVTKTATVVPITSNFKGYLICNSNTSIKTQDILDFNNDGEVAKPVASTFPTFYNMVALEDSIKIDFRTESEKKDPKFAKAQDYMLCLVKVEIYGNRIEAKKN